MAKLPHFILACEGTPANVLRGLRPGECRAFLCRRIDTQYALGRISDEDDVVKMLLGIMQHDDKPFFRDKAACALAYDQIHFLPKRRAA
jgi:hypothetical protein